VQTQPADDCVSFARRVPGGWRAGWPDGDMVIRCAADDADEILTQLSGGEDWPRAQK
jgi:hypothetical protein